MYAHARVRRVHVRARGIAGLRRVRALTATARQSRRGRRRNVKSESTRVRARVRARDSCRRSFLAEGRVGERHRHRICALLDASSVA